MGGLVQPEPIASKAARTTDDVSLLIFRILLEDRCMAIETIEEPCGGVRHIHSATFAH